MWRAPNYLGPSVVGTLRAASVFLVLMYVSISSLEIILRLCIISLVIIERCTLPLELSDDAQC